MADLKFYSIKRWNNQEVIFEGEFNNAGDCLKEALKTVDGFSHADFGNWNFTDYNFKDVDFSYKSFRGASFDGASFDGASFRGASFRGASFDGASFDGASFRGASFTGASFRLANFRGASFRLANFRLANFDSVSFRLANFDSVSFRLANFDSVSFVGASFWDCTGNSVNLISFQTPVYNIIYSKIWLQIGCERHTIEEWRSFDDNMIKSMDHQALEFWEKYKDFIFNYIALSPAL